MKNPNSHLVLEHVNNIVIPDGTSGITGVMNYLEDYLIKSDREHLFVIALDENNKPLTVNLAHIGTIDRSVASTRDIVKPALLSKGTKIVVLHNHPSGNVLPSNEDKIVTKKLSQACESVGLSLVEHYIVGLEKGKYGRLVQTEEIDTLLTVNYQQPYVSEVPVVNLKLNNAVNATYSKTYRTQAELASEISQFIELQTENKHYVFGFGTKNQLLSIIGASNKVFSHPKGMEMIRQRLIVSNANKIVFAHVKPLKNHSELLEHYTWVEKEKIYFEPLDMKVLDAFVFYKDKSLSAIYSNSYHEEAFFQISQEHSVAEQNNALEQPKKLTKEELKQLPILEVAQSLGMNMIRKGRDYYWDQHDSLRINPSKNIFSWFSRDISGDAIKLVQTIKEIPYAQAVQFLQAGTYIEKYVPKAEPKKPFVYQLKQHETAFEHAKRYLVNTRGLSPETVDFFVSKGAVVSAEYKTKDNPVEEVIVFQYKDYQNKIVGGSMQGITQNKELHSGKGYLKKIMFNSESSVGFRVDIGIPERLIFFESPIDLMSYYELNQDKLQNVRLIAMDGLKEVVIARALMEFVAFQHNVPVEKLESSLSRVNEYLDFVVENTTFFEEPGNNQIITLAVDNDAAGLKFIEKLQDKGCVFQVDLPENSEKLSKIDWNGLLYNEKEKNKQLPFIEQEQHVPFHDNKKGEQMMEKSTQHEEKTVASNSRLEQSKRKLERLQDELNGDIENVFNHQKQTNGQPMNDKRAGTAFFKRQEELENKVIDKHKEIELQKERVERLERQADYKERGLNRHGTGLEMSVPNISNIKAEIEKYYRGESFYTRDTIKRYEKQLITLEEMAERIQNVVISPGAQRLIDAGLVNQWEKNPTLYFVKGMRKVAFVLKEDGTFGLSDKYKPQTQGDRDKVIALLQQSREFNQTKDSAAKDSEYDVSDNAYLEKEEITEGTKKALDNKQEQINDRSNGMGSLQNKSEGSPAPVSLNNDTFEQTVTSHPTFSYPLLHFNTDKLDVQRRVENYHIADERDIRRLNQYAASIQTTAQWYQDVVADSRLMYVFLNDGEQAVLDVHFYSENFVHLTGIRPIDTSKKAGDFLDDFVKGYGHYANILVSHSLKEKLQVLPMLQDILDTQSFVLDDLSSVEKLHNLNLSKAIKAKDEDFLLLFKDKGLENVPASLMKLKGGLATSIQGVNEKIILGVYRERKGVLEQLSINTEYIKDGGKELMSILENREVTLEPIHQEVASDLSVIEAINKTKDSDGDGISDYDEIQQGTDPNNSRSNNKEKQQITYEKNVDDYAEDVIIDDTKYKNIFNLAKKFMEKVEYQGENYDENQRLKDIENLNQLVRNELSNQVLETLKTNEKTSVEEISDEVIKEEQGDTAPSISELLATNDKAGLMAHFKEGMKQFVNSEQYKIYLTAMSKLYQYSAHNIQMLVAQNPHIRYVASYQSWQKKFERNVVKGEKSLKIWVPLQINQKDNDGNLLLDENGETVKKTVFKLGSVFDISQTEGKSFPEPIYRLTKSVDDYKDLYRALKYVSGQNGVPISFEKIGEGINGLYDINNRRIIISNNGMSESQIIKTIIHEMAHSQLHYKGNSNLVSSDYSIQELQAESIAYVVSNHYGIDTRDYSFGYLHLWSGDTVDYSDLEKSLTIIQQTSKQFIEKIDTTLEKIKLHTLQKNQFNVNLEKAKHAETQMILNKSSGGELSKKTVVPTVEKY